LLIPFGKANADASPNQQYQQSSKYTRAANDDVIEGEFTEVKEENDRIK
jgi:hypothetical protein